MTRAEPATRPASPTVAEAPGSLVELVAYRAREAPQALLVADDRDRCLTALEFHQECARVAANLTDLEVGAGQLVSWIMPTGIDALLVMVGLSTVGAVQNPIIPMYGARDRPHLP